MRKRIMLVVVLLCGLVSYSWAGVFDSIEEVQGYQTHVIKNDTLFILHHENMSDNLGIAVAMNELYGDNQEKLGLGVIITMAMRVMQRYASTAIVYPLSRKVKVMTVSVVIIIPNGAIYGGDYSLNLNKFLRVGRVEIVAHHYNAMQDMNTLAYGVTFYSKYVNDNTVAQNAVANTKLMWRYGRW